MPVWEWWIAVPDAPSIVRTLAGNCLVGRVIGEMDYLTRPVYVTLFGDLIDERIPHVVLDLSGVTFCDSAGLNALLTAHRIATNNGASLALASVPPDLLRVLELTGADQVLPVHETVGEAATFLEGEPRREGLPEPSLHPEPS
jgi:anti-anti-sigma factor